MKALRAELAVELVGGVVSVWATCLTIQAYGELRSTDGTVGSLLAPTLRGTIIGCVVAMADPFTGLLRCLFHV